MSPRVTVSAAEPLLPAASWEVTVRTFTPRLSGTAPIDQRFVPVAPPLGPRSLDQVTDVNALSSPAVPATAIEAAVVA